MTHTAETANVYLNQFSERAPLSQSVVTLGGAGPNGTCQLPMLELLGYQNVQSLQALNIISASAFGYFIYLAFYQGKMRVDNYLNYDKGTRQIHEASLLRVMRYLLNFKRQGKSLYNNERVKDTVFYLLEADHASRELHTFDSNLVFWSYCEFQNKIVKITKETFPDMKVWEIITACLSVKSIHGSFKYKGYSFSDPMFSPKFKDLVRILLKNSSNHLFINYKKTQVSKNVIFLKNEPLRFPTLHLIYDFLSFTCNLKNPRIIKTHRTVTKTLLKSAQAHNTIRRPIDANEEFQSQKEKGEKKAAAV